MTCGRDDSVIVNISYGKQQNGWNVTYLRWLFLIGLMIISTPFMASIFLNNIHLYKSYILNKERNISTTCSLQLVESIPIGLYYPDKSPQFLSTYDAWKDLLKKAQKTLEIAAFYFTLLPGDVMNDTSASQGEDIFNRIIQLGKNPNMQIRIAQNKAENNESNIDIQILRKLKVAEVRSVNFPKLFGGVLHTKLWIVDGKHFYLGSANMDWRSLTQVKEMGVMGTDCVLMAEDLSKIFNEYWFLGKNSSEVPNKWPDTYNTKYNWDYPMNLKINNSFLISTFFSNSPPPLSSTGRMNDIDSITKSILSAKAYINIAVMDYYPLTIYTNPIRYWHVIDDALKVAAIEHKIEIKLLISWWKHSNPMEDNFLRSLLSISGKETGAKIEIKRFIVPDENKKKIPFTRVNHNKYMVTDQIALIGTSNWSGDYFINTAGISAIFMNRQTSANKTIHSDLKSVFDRDWNSVYAKNF